jgi:hypothetical protein
MTMTPQQQQMFETAVARGWDWFETPSGNWKFSRDGFTITVWFASRLTGKIVQYADHFSPVTRRTTTIRGGGAGVLRVLRGGGPE